MPLPAGSTSSRGERRFFARLFFDERANFVIVAISYVNENRSPIQRVRSRLAFPVRFIDQRSGLRIEHPLAPRTDTTNRAGSCFRQLMNQTMAEGCRFHTSIVARFEPDFYIFFPSRDHFFPAITEQSVEIRITGTVSGCCRTVLPETPFN